jgi:hypothetical protein
MSADKNAFRIPVKKEMAILEGSQELVAKESPIRNHLPWLILAIYIAVLCPLPLKFCVT